MAKGYPGSDSSTLIRRKVVAYAQWPYVTIDCVYCHSACLHPFQSDYPIKTAKCVQKTGYAKSGMNFEDEDGGESLFFFRMEQVGPNIK